MPGSSQACIAPAMGFFGMVSHKAGIPKQVNLYNLGWLCTILAWGSSTTCVCGRACAGPD